MVMAKLSKEDVEAAIKLFDNLHFAGLKKQYRYNFSELTKRSDKSTSS
jgi:hypothetical protein